MEKAMNESNATMQNNKKYPLELKSSQGYINTN